MGYANTPEQDRVINFWSNYEMSFKGIAIAGAGKSFLCRQLCARSDEPGLLLCFNKEIQMEAERKFPRNVACRTSHALALNGMQISNNHPIRKRFASSIFPNVITSLLDLKGDREHTANQWAAIILKTINAFCHSHAPSISSHHVTGINANSYQAEFVVKMANKLWQLIWLEDSKLPMPHDFYLKKWALDGAKLFRQFEYIFVDEAQDTNPVLLHALKSKDVPIGYVGDPWQSIYGFRGAVNALAQLDLKTFTLSYSFRYGQSIANVARAILAHSPTPPSFAFKGNPSIYSEVGPLRPGPYCIVCRNNATVFEQAVHAPGPVYILGGAARIFNLLESALCLMGKKPLPKGSPLRNFQNYNELREHAEDTDQSEIRVLVRIIEHHTNNLGVLLHELKQKIITDQAKAMTTIGTTHQVKGKEFRQVKMAEDFPTIDQVMAIENEQERSEEINLLYVAATRAIETLKINEAVKSYAQTEPNRGGI